MAQKVQVLRRDERILTIGANGFIGRELLCLLAQVPTVAIWRYDLTCTDINEHDIRGDIRDASHLLTTMRKIEPTIVVHLAAKHYIPHCLADPLGTWETNVTGTKNVVNAVTKINKDIRLIFASSAAVYASSDLALSEEMTAAPQDVYGASKLACEYLVRPLPNSAILRFFNVYGPEDTNPHVIPRIVSQLSGMGRIRIGNTRPRRDFVHVRDAARACQWAIGLDESGTYNIGTGVPTSIADLLDLIGNQVGRKLEVEVIPEHERPRDPLALWADIARANRAGWWPTIELARGLVELLRQHRCSGHPE